MTQTTTTAPCSVIIRNRNEMQHLKSVLRALQVQDTPHEVIVVDNCSDDGSVALAQSLGARVVPVRDFSYGRALNIGMAEAANEVCVILSAHSLPMGPHFLSACQDALRNPSVAGARCVYAGKGSDTLRWLDPERLVGSESPDHASKGVLASGCVIRRSTWCSIPFNEHVRAAEDKLWSEAVLRAGWEIVSPAPAFYSYLQPVSALAEARKNYVELQELHKYTGATVGLAATPYPALFRSVVTAPMQGGIPATRLSLLRLWLRYRFPR